jgi:hypothetical protein
LENKGKNRKNGINGQTGISLEEEFEAEVMGNGNMLLFQFYNQRLIFVWVKVGKTCNAKTTKTANI